jgi:primosomal protein N' (replication factor Y)
MTKLARVAVNVPGVTGEFDYEIPPLLIGQVITGCLVTVPFGKQVVQGIVTELPGKSLVSLIKQIIDLLDVSPVVNAYQIQLARWMSNAYYASFVDCLNLMIPPGLSQQADTLYSLGSEKHDTLEGLSDLKKRVIELIQMRGPLRGRQIDAAIPRQNWRAIVKTLIKQGVLLTQSILPKPTVNKKMVKTAQLACSFQVAERNMDTLARLTSTALPRRQAILRFLMKEAMPVNVSWVYAETGGNLSDLHVLEERDLIVLSESEVWRDPLDNMKIQPDTPPILTADQQSAWTIIQKAIVQDTTLQNLQTILIHGVTGSGKTELYLHAVKEVIAKGKQAIILVPEISLTPQTVRRFVSRFPGQVGVMHSRLSPGERYDTWRRARIGQLSVVVGPRSALFAPFSNLGLIVVDECHDDSYYQTDLRPFYHAVVCAIQYANITRAIVLMGSATPSVEMYFQARRKGWKLIEMPNRILAHQETVKKRLESLQPTRKIEITLEGKTAASLPLPFVHVVDMREELKKGNRSIFSHKLKEALTNTLLAGQQAILFLNRRGSATYVFCRNCGFVARCPRCDLPLAMHTDIGMLVCHTCGYQRRSFIQCPQCGNMQIREYGMGTEKVEEVVKVDFPQANVLRWDADTVRQKGAEDILLSHFIQHRADVLIGTQMLAKGLDLPFVTLVGVVLADVGLNFPDYRAPERTFQLLAQVAGRAGRSILGGQVILQTFQPWHYAIQRAAEHDFEGFYQIELENRRKLGYPPFNDLVRLEIDRLKWEEAKGKAEEMAEDIHTWLGENAIQDIELIGPAPAFFARVSWNYRWQLLLRGKNLRRVLERFAFSDWKVEIDPPDIL